MSASKGTWALIWAALCMAHVLASLGHLLKGDSLASTLGNLIFAAICVVLGLGNLLASRKWPQ